MAPITIIYYYRVNRDHLSHYYYLSSGLVVVEVHQRLGLSRLLPALPSVPGVDEGAREGDAEVDVVAAPGPLKHLKILDWSFSASFPHSMILGFVLLF